MKKVITAIGNEKIYNILKQENNIEIIINDIQYKEGVIEVLEQFFDVDFIIINNLLQGEISLEDLVKEIIKINNNIKIILIIEKKNEQAYNDGIYKILYNNENLISEIIKIINGNKYYNEIKEKNNRVKNIILEKDNKIKNKLNIKLNKFNFFKNNKLILNKSKIKLFNINNKKVNKKVNKNITRIITVTGPNGVGKSIISINLAKTNIYSKNKILIIDFNLNNYSISTILGAKKYPIKNSKNILENIIKVNKKIYLILGEFILNSENKITKEKIEILKNNYDLIIIDISPYNCAKNLIDLFNLSNFNLFLSDTNFLEISKSINILNMFINKYKINKNKFNILFNKYNLKSINYKLLEKIFSEFKIIGCLKFNKNYNKLINKNKKNFGGEKKIRKEYLYINKKIGC